MPDYKNEPTMLERIAAKNALLPAVDCNGTAITPPPAPELPAADSEPTFGSADGGPQGSPIPLHDRRLTATHAQKSAAVMVSVRTGMPYLDALDAELTRR